MKSDTTPQKKCSFSNVSLLFYSKVLRDTDAFLHKGCPSQVQVPTSMKENLTAYPSTWTVIKLSPKLSPKVTPK